VEVLSAWRRGALAVGVAMSIPFGRAQAQTLRGVVRDSSTQRPVTGAVLIVFDSSGRVLARNITDERGAYAISLGGGARRMRLQRIGFRPRDVSVAPIATGTAELDVTIAALPTILEPVRVAASACSRRSDQGAALALLEQARAGLLATIVAREANPSSMVLLKYRRVMDGNSDRVERMSVQIDSARSASSFHASQAGRDFARKGFTVDDAGGKTYFGPDPDVLLNDDFIAAYCFRVEGDRKRPTEIGLAFAPADRKRDRIDIDGVLWIDTVARALRNIEFRYIGFDREIDALHPGGRVSFREMTNGSMLVDRWHLRLPAANYDTIPSPDPRSGPAYVRRWLYAQESGGELAVASWPRGATWTAPLGRLRVRAVTHAGAPAVGTLVRLTNTQYVGRADSSGRIEIPRLLPGPYSLIIEEPRLAKIDVSLTTPISFTAVRDSTIERALEVPTGEDYARARCEEDKRSELLDSTYLVGRVVDADGRPVPDVKVRVFIRADGDGPNDWVDGLDFYVTGTNGLFQLCPRAFGNKRGTRIRLVASRGNATPTTLLLTIVRSSLNVVEVPFSARP